MRKRQIRIDDMKRLYRRSNRSMQINSNLERMPMAVSTRKMRKRLKIKTRKGSYVAKTEPFELDASPPTTHIVEGDPDTPELLHPDLPLVWDKNLLYGLLTVVRETPKRRWVAKFSSGSELLAAMGITKSWDDEMHQRVEDGLCRLGGLVMYFRGTWIEPSGTKMEGTKIMGVLSSAKITRKEGKRDWIIRAYFDPDFIEANLTGLTVQVHIPTTQRLVKYPLAYNLYHYLLAALAYPKGQRDWKVGVGPLLQHVGAEDASYASSMNEAQDAIIKATEAINSALQSERSKTRYLVHFTRGEMCNFTRYIDDDTDLKLITD